MDIGVPYKDLGAVDITAAADFVSGLPEEAWTHNAFRQEILADKAHYASQAIIFRHEWTRDNNPWGVHNLEDLILTWSRPKGVDPEPFMPVDRFETALGPVYTFREWDAFKEVLEPVVEQAVGHIKTANGIVIRIALVALPGGAEILPHADGHPFARVAHRLHVPLTGSKTVRYRIGKQKFFMKPGRVYDFNNRWRHSVKNIGKSRRVNLFIDYYADPKLFVPPVMGPL